MPIYGNFSFELSTEVFKCDLVYTLYRETPHLLDSLALMFLRCNSLTAKINIILCNYTRKFLQNCPWNL